MNANCITLLLAAMAIHASAATAAPEDSLAAYWKLDGAPGELVAPDATGSFSGTLTGSEFARSGYLDNAAFFTAAADNRIDFPGTDALLTGPTWTVSFWFRQRNQTSTGSKLRTMFATNNAGVGGVTISAVRSNGSELQFRIGATEKYFPFPWDLGWHHVVLTRDAAQARAYVDGTEIGQLVPGTAVAGPIVLGRDTTTDTNRRFNGFIDDVRVYTRTFSDADVVEIRGLKPLPPQVSIPFTGDFAGGSTGYYCFRIPAMVTAADGTILAFSEGRVSNCNDDGDIDLVLSRSHDNGATWGPIQKVWDESVNTAGNPCPVLDRNTGRIWLPMSHNLGGDTIGEIQAGTSVAGRTAWMTYSDDNGATWAPPTEITDQVKLPAWRWYATGPGASIQTESGRLVVPITFSTGSSFSGCSVFYSDDHGDSWHLGGNFGDRVNEAQVVELADNRLMLNMRRSGNRPLYRAVSTSTNGGTTWSAITQDMGLPDCAVQASILRYTLAGPQDKNRILFCNPANNEAAAASSRTRMTVRMSTDEASTWQYSREIYAGWSAYSCLSLANDFHIGCLYEWGDSGRYQRIVYEKLSASWLTSGAETVPAPSPDVLIFN